MKDAQTTSPFGPEDAASLGVSLTNLDEPLFDGAGATKRDLINYLDERGRPDHSGACGSPTLGDPCASRSGSLHAEEPAVVYAFMGTAGDDVGGVVEARGHLRALQ